MKKILVIATILLMSVLLFQTVLGVSVTTPSGTVDSGIKEASLKFWGSFLLIARALAFGLILFAGIRYMFASSDTRADIKKQTVILIIGAVLVFAAEPVVRFIKKSVESIL